MPAPTMMRRFRTLPALLVLLTGIGACDQFDLTGVENPNLTDEDFLKTPDAAATWLRGVERTFMQTLDDLVVNGEIASDNYFNNYTTLTKVFDLPRLDHHDEDVRALQQSVGRLREAATFGLDRVLEADPASTAEQEAEFLFYRAMARIFSGEYFTALPAADRGEVLDGAAHLNAALDDLERARTLTSDEARRTGYTLAMARAHYRLGNPSQAVSAATQVLAADPDFVRTADYDGVTGPGNSMQGLLTGSTNNLQPLPRLDFLDPKFPNRGPQIESAQAFLKAEEAHLILAEAALASGGVESARSQLLELRSLVASRPVEEVDSRLQERGRRGGAVIYPNRSTDRVAFEPGEPFVEGLILDRSPDPVQVSTVSGTSVTAERIESAANESELLYLLYLMRQEIFLGEGRRVVDLGLRYPLSFAEVQVNSNAVAGEWYTEARIPSFIPLDGGMDRFDYDETNGTVVIHHDMNRILVENRGAAEVLPFH